MPSRYTELAQEYSAADPQEKIRILRQELLGPIITVQEVAALFKQIDPEVCQRLPPNIPPAEFERLVQWLSTAGVDLKEILDALAPEAPAHR